MISQEVVIFSDLLLGMFMLHIKLRNPIVFGEGQWSFEATWGLALKFCKYNISPVL